MPEADSDRPRIGLDEMNLAEFPIATLWDRVPQGVKTIKFSDTIKDDLTGQRIPREVTITGGDAFGLPTATDDAVIVALIELTRMHNNFTDPTVKFTRYELIKILGWADNGPNFRRIEESFKRWLGVSIYYEGAWRDNAEKTWGSGGIHLIESYHLYDGATRKQARAQGKEHRVLSDFTWGEKVFKSFRANYLKPLDLKKYFKQIQLPIARRLYRFLDKRFHHRPVVTMRLETLAFEKIGMSRTLKTYSIKRLLDRALGELEVAEVVEKVPEGRRYFKKDEKWHVTIKKWEPKASPTGAAITEDNEARARAYWDGLDLAGKDIIEEQAREWTDDETRAKLDDRVLGKITRQVLRIDYIMKELLD